MTGTKGSTSTPMSPISVQQSFTNHHVVELRDIPLQSLPSQVGITSYQNLAPIWQEKLVRSPLYIRMIIFYLATPYFSYASER